VGLRLHTKSRRFPKARARHPRFQSGFVADGKHRKLKCVVTFFKVNTTDLFKISFEDLSQKIRGSLHNLLWKSL